MCFWCDSFSLLLYGHKFTLQTDHKPLLALFSENKAIPTCSQSNPEMGMEDCFT